MKRFYNPAQLFTFSFIALIMMGSALLLLPFATRNGINLIDALFISTSAVCVTGLATLDIATTFTVYGQIIIICLIQLGALGVLTFASYFSYFFKGGSTYENQFVNKDIINTNKLGDVFVLMKRIILITFFIEVIGATLIFITTSNSSQSTIEHAFFSIFHSISSFCNAGFSTLTKGLAEESYVYNYEFQIIIALLYIFGGLGFPIVINLLQYLKHQYSKVITKYLENKNTSRPWVININSKINLITTLSITIAATVIIWILENDNLFSVHSDVGRWVTAFFTATTPRTAGYNTIDFGLLKTESVLFIILLMWIGASPNSTGGGIKTSTFAVAVLNIYSLIKGKENVEIFKRKIAEVTIKRAFATMTLSLLVIGIGILLISIFEKKYNLLQIAFETFSAYSTVGLSMGITFGLSSYSKIVIIILMFFGRVTMLTIMIALFKKVKFTNYRYAEEELTIN